MFELIDRVQSRTLGRDRDVIVMKYRFVTRRLTNRNFARRTFVSEIPENSYCRRPSFLGTRTAQARQERSQSFSRLFVLQWGTFERL